jgi:ribosomal protein S27AE
MSSGGATVTVTTDEEGQVKPPLRRCPKCGDPWGFASASPMYELGDPGSEYPVPADRLATEFHSERFSWACRRCGYVIYTPTLV